MRDDDKLLELPDAEFGSGVIGVCDICGTRQAVIVLEKERFKLCVLDFLNKAWTKSDKTPGVVAPAYRSERLWFETDATPSHRAQAIRLTPTKIVRHPVVLVAPDVFGITTTLLDAAIRFAREGFEVLVPDLLKTDGFATGRHVALRAGSRLRGGVAVGSPGIAHLVGLYRDALAFLRDGEMVDPTKSAVFGTSYGASLALALAAQDTRIGAVALAYPMPVLPADLPALVTAPVLWIAGASDRAAAKARQQLVASRSARSLPLEVAEIPRARHHFLARDLRAYELAAAEAAWGRIVGFLKRQLMPPPPRPPSPPVKTSVPPPAPSGSAPVAAPAASRPAPAPSSSPA